MSTEDKDKKETKEEKPSEGNRNKEAIIERVKQLHDRGK